MKIVCAHSGDLARSIATPAPPKNMTSKIEEAVFRVAGKVEAYNEKHGDDSSPTSSTATTSRNDKVFDAGHRRHDTDLSKEGKGDRHESKDPPGGYDDTPVPKAPPGYTLKITFHRATNLPMADIGTFSSDPYIVATLSTGLAMRHKEDPPLRLRTPTVRRDTEPEWNTEWIVANVPASGFRLKCRIYDEDPADHDDRLGNVTIDVQGLDDGWPGIQEAGYKIKKRMASKRAYIMRGLAVALHKTKHMDGNLFVSVENLGKTKDEDGGRCYTVGPMWYTKHYSPMLGRLAGRKTPNEDESPRCTGKKRKAERYNFQANQFQMRGPVPPELYHRFVEFKPFVKRMFTSSGIEGYLLSKALHHQHARVYNYDRTTEYGLLGSEPSTESTLKFLDLVHWDEGGRIFTYVLTLDALFRFTETGKEFGIDFLSKHTMHSDVNIYIAYSGEFFVRRLRHKNKLTPEEHLHSLPGAENEEQQRSPSHSPHSPRHHTHHRLSSNEGGQSSHHREHLRPQTPNDQTEEHPPADLSGGPPNDAPPRDPRYYELVIDNDSGTYRPNAQLLPLLKEFLHRELPGLHIAVLDCQEDAELQQKMKKEQRERKAKEGRRIVYRQASQSSGSSISSSDLSDLDDVEDGITADDDGVVWAKQRGTWKALGKDAKTTGKARKRHWRIIAKGREKLTGGDDDDDEDAEGKEETKKSAAPADKEEKSNGGEKVDSEQEAARPTTPRSPIARKPVPNSPGRSPAKKEKSSAGSETRAD